MAVAAPPFPRRHPPSTLLWIVAAAFLLPSVQGRAPSSGFAAPASRRLDLALPAVEPASELSPPPAPAAPEKDPSATHLSFVGRASAATDPFPVRDDLAAFFAGRGQDVLLAETCDASTVLSSSPGGRSSVVRATKGNLRFPGFTVRTDIVMERTHRTRRGTGMPEMAMVFVDARQVAQGPRPIVWLFDQLTGNVSGEEEGERGDGKARPASRVATSTSTVVYAEAVDGASARICLDCKLEIKFAMGPRALRLMPVSQEVFQRRGSAIVGSILESEVLPAVHALREAYVGDRGDTNTNT